MAEDSDTENPGEDGEEPRVQVSPPKKRRRFSLHEKLRIVRNIRYRIERFGASQRSACRELKINHKQVIEWKKQFNNLQNASNKRAKSLCKGRVSALAPYRSELLAFIFELRESGMAVNNTMVLLKAAQLSSDFRRKSRGAQDSIIRRFVKINGMVH